MTPNLSSSASPQLVGCAAQPFPEVPTLLAISSIAKQQQQAVSSNSSTTATVAATDWKCRASKKSLRTTNSIRAIVDPIVANGIKSGEERGDGKDHISLALGDPTVGSSLPVCTAAMDAIVRAVSMTAPGNTNHATGYAPACGTLEARHAIATHHHENYGGPLVSPDHVIVASGCSGTLELVLTALLDEDSILLVPKPGFPLYQVICESHGASVAHYELDPDRQWECDLEHMEQLILSYDDANHRVRGIVINNPSNPTGSVYTEHHLRQILALAQRYQLPVIADEIYGDLTFDDTVFTSMAKVMMDMGSQVPVIVTSGLAKQYLLPGWRVGWAVFYDSTNCALTPVLEGVQRLAQVILGASHLVQSIIPTLLTPATIERQTELQQFKSKLKKQLALQAKLLCKELSKCPGLNVYEPQGAMYTMIKIDLQHFDDAIGSDVDFTKKLLEEENVFVLPGQAFGLDGAVRVVYCADPETLQQASDRVLSFCQRHSPI